MADTTNVNDQTLPGGNVNKPASGTYGEGAALERLRSSFPSPGPQAGAAPGPAPMPTPPSGAGVSTAPSGLPAGLMAPTQNPDVPAFTPLATPPVNPVASAATSRQANMARLDALLNSPTVSAETKAWAQEMIDMLIEGSRQ